MESVAMNEIMFLNNIINSALLEVNDMKSIIYTSCFGMTMIYRKEPYAFAPLQSLSTYNNRLDIGVIEGIPLSFFYRFYKKVEKL